MRQLFAIMLTMCGISDPVALWHLFKDEMAEDILHQYRQRCNINNLNFNEEIYNRPLVAIDDCIYNMGGNPLRSYGFQAPNRSAETEFPTELLRESSYDLAYLK